MHACIRSAEEAVITNAEYLRLLGFPDRRCDAGELWRHLIGSIAWNQSEQREHAHLPLQVMLDHGRLHAESNVLWGRSAVKSVW